ncbi:MAG: hypothetical protein R8K50_09370, partial [Mariprofundus sp.]
MFEYMTTGDITLNVLFAIGMLQLAWFSVMLLRRGIHASAIQQAILPLITLWILMWPVYSDPRSLWGGVIALLLPCVLAVSINTPFWQHLRLAWTAKTLDVEL